MTDKAARVSILALSGSAGERGEKLLAITEEGFFAKMRDMEPECVRDGGRTNTMILNADSQPFTLPSAHERARLSG